MVTSSPADGLYKNIENETRILSKTVAEHGDQLTCRLNVQKYGERDACPLNWQHVERPHVCDKLRFKIKSALEIVTDQLFY